MVEPRDGQYTFFFEAIATAKIKALEHILKFKEELFLVKVRTEDPILNMLHFAFHSMMRAFSQKEDAYKELFMEDETEEPEDPPSKEDLVIIFKMMVAGFPELMDSEEDKENGLTILQKSVALYNSQEVTELLVDLKFNLDYRLKLTGQTALHYAIANNLKQ